MSNVIKDVRHNDTKEKSLFLNDVTRNWKVLWALKFLRQNFIGVLQKHRLTKNILSEQNLIHLFVDHNDKK